MMEYHGKLYGKVGRTYFPLTETSDDIDELRDKLKEMKEALMEVHTIADYYHDKQYQYTEMPYKNWTSVINKVYKLIH